MTVVGSSNPHGLLVQETLFTTGGFPMEFDIMRLASFADEGVCVDTKTIHVPVILGDTHVIEQEGEHVKAFGVVGEEIEDPPILLDVGLGIGFEGVDHVGELEAITDEEDGEVVSDEVKVTLSGVKFDGKSSGVPQGFRAATLVDDGGEADDEGSLNSRGAKEVSTGEVRDVMCDFKKTLCTGSPRMHHSLRDPFPVEVCKLLHQMIILQKNWTS